MSSVATTALGEVAAFIRGITFRPDDIVPLGTPGSLGCMRTKNVQEELDLSDVWGIPSSFVKRADQYLREGDLLVSSANSWNLVGKCSWVPRLPWESTFGGFISVLRPNISRIDPRYLYHWFASDRIQATVRSFGRQTTNISNLDVDRCLSLPVPFPAIEEQRRIAAILDKADALRAMRREAFAKVDQLTESIFIAMFGDPATNPKRWPTAAIRELGQVTTGATPPSGLDGMFDGPIPFVTPGDLESDGPVRRTVTEAGAARARTVRAGATFVCCIGATIGKMGSAHVRSAFNQQINAIEWNQDVDSEFGLALMRFFRPTIVAWGASTTLPILNKSTFERIEVPVPPLELQRAFAIRLACISNMRNSMRAELEVSGKLFSALEVQAFRGDL